ncbi:hypothetical protein [Streptomyces glaucus]|uniref:Secreted protein n=1 Tax=Streptomyces glaucus TaxID=284029 RepID=A0ABP5X8Y2_9ACTN
MITSVVRGIAVTALTTTIALLPTQAQAEGSDEDNDIETIELTGVNWLDTSPPHIRVGDKWVVRLDLYTKRKTGSAERPLQRAGDGQAECSAVQVRGSRVTTVCTRVLSLKKGTLTLSDMITSTPRKPVTAKTAITGGTGQYRSAYGDGYLTLDGRYSHWKLDVDE